MVLWRGRAAHGASCKGNTVDLLNLYKHGDGMANHDEGQVNKLK